MNKIFCDLAILPLLSVTAREAITVLKVKSFLRKHLNNSWISKLKVTWLWMQQLMYFYGRLIKTPINLIRNYGKIDRNLEIGPGSKRIHGFETLNIVWDRHVDYVLDASKKLPFPSGSFNLIYASHVLEHIPWYQVQDVLNEWVRLLTSGGQIEIWVPDAYKIASLLVDIENGIDRLEWHDGWRPLNNENDPYKWISGRLFWGAERDYPSWHLALLTPKYLEKLFFNSGLINIRLMDNSENRGIDYGWHNLGIRGTKR